jgi:2'-5' RNA ligase
VHLHGFGAFPPRVIYLHVERSAELLALQANLIRYLETKLKIFDPTAKTRPFKPHLTVGFRDLTQQNFQLAWAEFQSQLIEFTFTVTNLTLLLHDGQRWQVYQEFRLGGEQPLQQPK